MIPLEVFMKVSRILSTRGPGVHTIRPEQTLREVIQLLAQYNIGALVVVDADGKLVGIISERDVIRQAAQREDVFSLTVEAVMTRKVITGTPQDDLISIAHTMTERRFRHLPILDRGQLVGLISIGDVLKTQRDEYRGEIDTLETQMLAEQEK
jgi:CBS domain-containing protein